MTLAQTARLVSGSPQQVAHQASIWFARLSSSLHRINTAWAVRRRFSRDARQLYSFSDRELWDLGLSRSDVPSIAAGTFRRHVES
jgi:uncharacterized protein YjiS (DUF1127 family)